MNDELDEEVAQEESERSQMAKELERLKDATLQAAAKRERLPQPLFWSLFNTEIRRLKKLKKSSRILEELFGR